jgi:hypothetical protein
MAVEIPANLVLLLARKLKADERGPQRGRPKRLAVYHEMMAAHFLWRRTVENEQVKVTRSIIAQTWGVSEAAVEKNVREYRIAARRWLENKDSKTIEILIDDVAARFNP